MNFPFDEYKLIIMSMQGQLDQSSLVNNIQQFSILTRPSVLRLLTTLFEKVFINNEMNVELWSLAIFFERQTIYIQILVTSSKDDLSI